MLRLPGLPPAARPRRAIPIQNWQASHQSNATKRNATKRQRNGTRTVGSRSRPWHALQPCPLRRKQSRNSTQTKRRLPINARKSFPVTAAVLPFTCLWAFPIGLVSRHPSDCMAEYCHLMWPRVTSSSSTPKLTPTASRAVSSSARPEAFQSPFPAYLPRGSQTRSRAA